MHKVALPKTSCNAAAIWAFAMLSSTLMCCTLTWKAERYVILQRCSTGLVVVNLLDTPHHSPNLRFHMIEGQQGLAACQEAVWPRS